MLAVIFENHETAKQPHDYHYLGYLVGQRIVLTPPDMGVHKIIKQQHTVAETEGKEYRHEAEIFLGGYLAETSERNGDSDRNQRPEQLAVRQLSLIINEMEDYGRSTRDNKPNHFYELVIGIIALYKAEAKQKKRLERNYYILAKDEDYADNRSKNQKAGNLNAQNGYKAGYKETNPHKPIRGEKLFRFFSYAFKFRVFRQVHTPHLLRSFNLSRTLYQTIRSSKILPKDVGGSFNSAVNFITNSQKKQEITANRTSAAPVQKRLRRHRARCGMKSAVRP